MLDQVAIAIATGAAGNVIAYMLNGRVDALRAQVTHLFRRDSEQERAIVLQRLDDDVLALAKQTRSDAELTARWAAMFATLLETGHGAREELSNFAAAPVPGKTVHIGSQHNHGSGVFIGGDNHGGIEVSTDGNSR